MKANKTIRWKLLSKYRMSWLGKENLDSLGQKALRYTKNKKTIAPKGSNGCYCFESKAQAILSFENSFQLGDRIIPVKTYGKGIRKNEIIEGTICYPAVMPLE